MAKVIDCFMFFDEFDALTIRLHELDPVVDRFVLVEASTTHSGMPKPFYFTERADEFREFADKITTVHVNDLPTFDNRWIAEHLQRNAALRGLTDAAADDIVLVCDCDEIPRASAVRALPEVLAHPGDVVGLQMAVSYYALNLRSRDLWNRARATRRLTLDYVSPQELRTMYVDNDRQLADAGWHFSYLAPQQERIAKIESKAGAFAHRELDITPLVNDDSLRKAVAKDVPWWQGVGPSVGQGVLHRVPVDETFPAVVRAEPWRWRDYVADGAGDWRYELGYQVEKSKEKVVTFQQRATRKLRKLVRTAR